MTQTTRQIILKTVEKLSVALRQPAPWSEHDTIEFIQEARADLEVALREPGE